MTALSEKEVYEIVQHLDTGLRCFIHRESRRIFDLPDLDRNPDIETEAWQEDIDKVTKDPDEYIEFEVPRSRDSFRIMAEFTEQLSGNDQLKHELIQALNKRKPFREFKFVIDNSGDYRQQWFHFKQAWLEEWVRQQFREATS